MHLPLIKKAPEIRGLDRSFTKKVSSNF